MEAAAVVLVVLVVMVMLNLILPKEEMVELGFKSQLHSEIQQLILIQTLSGILLVVAVDVLLQDQLRIQELLELVEMVVEEGVLIMMHQSVHLSNIMLLMDLLTREEVVEVPLGVLIIPTLEFP
tara:strand:+ start:1130 stop:1501 length:372 start_codon:yes stop_codon:yes gene_type:complete